MEKVHFSSLSNEWCTPKNIFKYYNNKFNFKLDAAANKDNALCENYFSEQNNALNKEWTEIY